MTWRLAKSLETLRAQVNARWPNRSRQSDGSVGDSSHGARKSDHNPDARGVVHAIDITHDPANGFDSYAFADLLLQKQDRRLSYVISNRRIGSGPFGQQSGVWRKYNGANPHNHHVHISVVHDSRCDDVSPWDIAGAVNATPIVQARFVPPPATLRLGDHGDLVSEMQRQLNAAGMALKIDGDFGLITERALRGFQAAHNMAVDGIAGPQFWQATTQINRRNTP